MEDGAIRTFETEFYRYTIIKKGDRVKLLKTEKIRKI